MEKAILSNRGIFNNASVFGHSFVKPFITEDTVETMVYNHNIAHGAYFTLCHTR